MSALDHEVTKQRINREAGRSLLKNYEVLIVRCGMANARTLHCHSCRFFLRSPIERIHPKDAPGQSMHPPKAHSKLRASSTRNFSLTTMHNPLAFGISLLFPRIAVRVITISLPKT